MESTAVFKFQPQHTTLPPQDPLDVFAGTKVQMATPYAASVAQSQQSGLPAAAGSTSGAQSQPSRPSAAAGALDLISCGLGSMPLDVSMVKKVLTLYCKGFVAVMDSLGRYSSIAPVQASSHGAQQHPGSVHDMTGRSAFSLGNSSYTAPAASTATHPQPVDTQLAGGCLSQGDVDAVATPSGETAAASGLQKAIPSQAAAASGSQTRSRKRKTVQFVSLDGEAGHDAGHLQRKRPMLEVSPSNPPGTLYFECTRCPHQVAYAPEAVPKFVRCTKWHSCGTATSIMHPIARPV